MRKFPHLEDSPSYPGPGRELYKQIPGSFDSGEWQEGATITLLSVPWGIYDAETQTDVPGFDTTVERDTWFNNYIYTHNNNESHVLDTYVRYQIKGSVDLPFTFDYAARYNYMIVDYPDAPVQYGTEGLRRWFFHITSIDYDSPSCTRVSITPDWWTTCAPLMTINHMILERGHAPVALSNVDKYLKDPVNNSDYLLSPDVDFGGAERVTAAKNFVFNDGIIYAVVCMRGIDLTGNFADYGMSATAQVTFTDGQLTSWQCAVKASDLEQFLKAMHSQAPQACENIEAVFLAGEKLINLGSKVSIFGIDAWLGLSGKHSSYTFALNKGDFGFDSKIADLAKLYTAPYSHIEVSDEKGQITRVNVEELSGAGVVVDYAFNAAFPWLKLSANVANMGGAAQTINFANVSAHDISAGGRWYQTLRSWDVPCFKVCQVASETYDYQQHFNVEQQKKNAETTYTNTINSIDTSYNNSVASNNAAYNNAINNAAANYTNSINNNATAQTNANNNATLAVANNAVTTAANAALVESANSYSNEARAWANIKIAADATADKKFANDGYAADVAGLATAATNNQTTFGVNATQVLSSALTGATTGATIGSIPGALTGAVAGLALPALSFATTAASNAVSQSNSNLMYQASIDSINDKRDNAISYAVDSTNESNNQRTNANTIQTNAANSTTTNSANNITTNAANTKATADSIASLNKTTAETTAKRTLDTGNANAERSKFTNTGNAQRTRSNALAAVQAGIDNAGMQAANAFGIEQAGEYSSTRPQVLSVNVVTESKNAIAQAATQFKRWGYTLNQAFNFETWGLMKHFTFWQVADVWATGPGSAPEEGQDAVRNMLYSGVTCWKNPAEIGTVSIYDN